MRLIKSSLILKLAVFGLLVLFCPIISAAETSKETFQKMVSEAEKFSREWSSDSYQRSLDLFTAAAKGWAAAGEFQQASKALRDSAGIYFKLSDFENASKQLAKALQIDDRVGNKDGKTLDLSLLSLVNLRAGKLKESEKLLQEALRLSEETENPLIRATALFSAAQYSYSYGNTRETIKLFQETLALAEKSSDKGLAAQALLYLAFSYIKNGNPTPSLENAQKALQKFEETGDRRWQAICYVGLGFINTIINEKQAALVAYTKGETMFPKDFEWLEKGKLYNGLATIYEEYNQLQLAEDYRRKALECYQQSNYPNGQLATLPSLAKLIYQNGDTKAAGDFYDKALKLAYKLNDNYYIAFIKKDLGEMSLGRNLPDEAIKNFNEAREIYLKLNITSPALDEGIAEAFQIKGDPDLARKYFRQAQQASHETKEILVEAKILHKLATLDLIENKTGEALKNIKESLDITETLYSDVINSRLKRTFFSNVFDRYELYINLLMKSHTRSREENYALMALQASEKARARSMQENLLLSEANFTKDADPELIKREKEIMNVLNLKNDRLTDALSSNAEKTVIDNLDGEINELTNQLEEIKAIFKQNSPIYSVIKNPPAFDVAEFQKNILDADSLLLEYSLGSEESFLWCVSKNEVSSFVLPARDVIEGRIQTLRQLLENRGMNPDESIENYQARLKKAETDYWVEAKNLSMELLGPVSDKITGKRLIFVADGKLHYFPISALPLPNSFERDEPLLVANEVVYEPSAMTLKLLTAAPKPANQPPKNVLVFADPVFSKDDARLSNVESGTTDSRPDLTTLNKLRFAESLSRLPRLEASQTEAQAISQITGPDRSTILSGFSATRERLFTPDISDFKILHFATHGLIDENRPELSGIVLSRFDEQGQNLEGLVRLQDIYTLNLKSDLVVLSACETGIGKEVKGEGLLSLNNAFLQVGAKSVLSSFWKVDDAATKELMKYFYEELATEKFTTSEALRRAQIKMRQNPQYRSPFYWAAFTIHGDYRNTPKLVSDSGYRAYLMPAISVLFIFGIYAGYKFIQRRRQK